MSDAPCSNFLCNEDLPASGDCLDLLTSEQIDSAIEEASYLLYRMSDRRVYGLCEDTVRPSVRDHAHDGVCQCYSIIRLGERPERILWVKVDGEVLPPSAYKLERGDQKLYRVDGDYWPHCQDLTAPIDADGSFAIRYRHGSPIDPVTKHAAIDLTMELVKLLVPGFRPQLPADVTSVSRRGVSLSKQDRDKIIRGGASTLDSVNQFMATHNPNNEPETYVYSPDTSPDLHNFGRTG